MSQNEKILRHLKRKSISTYEAYDKYGITRLSGRIYDLRNQGYQILAKPVRKDGGRYASYRLVA